MNRVHCKYFRHEYTGILQWPWKWTDSFIRVFLDADNNALKMGSDYTNKGTQKVEYSLMRT